VDKENDDLVSNITLVIQNPRIHGNYRLFCVEGRLEYHRTKAKIVSLQISDSGSVSDTYL